MNINEIEAEILKIPENSLVAINFPELDLDETRQVMRMILPIGEKHKIDFMWIPKCELKVMVKEKSDGIE